MKETFQNLNKFNFKSGFKLGFDTGPEADWLIIFISSLTLSILVIALAIYMFIKVGNGEVFTVEKPVEEEAKMLDTKLLETTVLYYQNKAIEFERIKIEGVESVDPSI